MATLGQLSAARIGHGLSAIIAEWPSDSVPSQLRAGRDAALGAIRKYVPDFRYDIEAADSAAREIDAWADRHEEQLARIMESSAEGLPAELQLEMGNDRARNFILSSFTEAAAGLGPWDSGEVARAAAAGDRINESWARSDADDRLDTFALLVKLDREGDLEKIFVPPADGTQQGSQQGFGFLPVWAIVIVLVAVAAAFVVLILGWRRLTLNNRLMADLCRQAQKEGRTEVVQACLKATENLTISPFERAGVELAGKIGTGLITAGLVYLGLRFGLPYLWARRSAGASSSGRGDIKPGMRPTTVASREDWRS